MVANCKSHAQCRPGSCLKFGGINNPEVADNKFAKRLD